jgi:hypothetical protein
MYLYGHKCTLVVDESDISIIVDLDYKFQDPKFYLIAVWLKLVNYNIFGFTNYETENCVTSKVVLQCEQS